MKIMLFYPGILIGSKGGMEKVFCSMGNELVQRGYEVLAVGFENKRGLPAFPMLDKVNFINAGENVEVKLSFMQRLKRNFIFNKLQRHTYSTNILDLVMLNKIKPIIEYEKPDIIISFNTKGTRVLKKINNLNIPVVSMLHGVPEVYFEKADSETKRYFMMSECVQVLMPSFVENLHKYIEHDNVVVIGNAVSQIDIICNYDNKIIINIARFDKDKGQDLLIKAFAKISEDFDGWKLEFYGGEFTKGYLQLCKNLVKDCGLESRISFCGTTDNVYDVLGQSMMFVFPSFKEGFGLALAEAMSAGLPCIGYKSASAVNELIKDGKNGILCEDGIDSLANAMKELMSDEEKRRKYGLQAKEDMKMYAPKVIWDAWEDLILKTVKNYLG